MWRRRRSCCAWRAPRAPRAPSWTRRLRCASQPLFAPPSPSPCPAHRPLQCSKYQEQPRLLDPHLEALLAPLTAVLRAAARQAAGGPASPELLASAQRAARLLHQLALLRGYKARRLGVARGAQQPGSR